MRVNESEAVPGNPDNHDELAMKASSAINQANCILGSQSAKTNWPSVLLFLPDIRETAGVS